MNDPIETSVRKFIGDNFLYREGADNLAPSASFLEAGLIDSTGILELVGFLEKTFAFQVADNEIVPDNLDSIGQITGYIHRKLNGAEKAEKAGTTHAN